MCNLHRQGIFLQLRLCAYAISRAMNFASRARIRLWLGALRRIPSSIAICLYPWNEVSQSELMTTTSMDLGQRTPYPHFIYTIMPSSVYEIISHVPIECCEELGLKLERAWLGGHRGRTPPILHWIHWFCHQVLKPERYLKKMSLVSKKKHERERDNMWDKKPFSLLFYAAVRLIAIYYSSQKENILQTTLPKWHPNPKHWLKITNQKVINRRSSWFLQALWLLED